MSQRLVCPLAIALTFVLGNAAHAQYTSTSAQYLTSATRSFLYNRPSVSPYVNLATRENSFGLPTYHTLVRPQIEQREQQMAQQVRNAQIQRQISQIQDDFRQSQAQAANQFTTGRTGWTTRGLPRFGSTLNYYPGFSAIPRR